MSRPWRETVGALGEPMLTLEAETLHPWQQPIVYVWSRGDLVLYVGVSGRGIARPVDPGHEKLRGFRAGDRLSVWALPNAWEVEMRLIRDLKPLHNSPPSATVLCPRCRRSRFLRRHRERGYCDWCAYDKSPDGERRRQMEDQASREAVLRAALEQALSIIQEALKA